MNKKYKKNLNFTNYYMGGNLNRTIMIILPILIFIYAYYIGNSFSLVCAIPNFIDAVIYFFNDPILIVFVFFIPMLLVAINVMNRCDKLKEGLLRFKLKRNYIDSLISYCLKINTIFFIFCILVVFISTFCLINNEINVMYVSDYKTINLLYLIVYLFKIYFFGQWLSISSILLIKSRFYIFCLIINMFTYFSVFTYSTSDSQIIRTIGNIPILISNYIYMTNYSSYTLELLCFIFFVIILFIIAKIFYNKCNKRMSDIV